MKTVENKKSEIPGDAKNYSDLIMLCIKNTPQGGYDVSEMRKRIKIMDILEKGENTFEFEDADFKCVQECVKIMRWGFIHKEFVNFIDYISGL